MKITKYTIETQKTEIDLHAAVVSDLHARPYDKVIEALERISPDTILLPGDILEIATDNMQSRNQTALAFLKHASEIAPCYYCYGNHEIYYSHAKKGQPKATDPSLASNYEKQIRGYGIHLINDTIKQYDNHVAIGGLVCGRDMDPALNRPHPNLEILSQLASFDGFKILLCHYPHYYEKYLKDTDIDLILSGHAHGGQWRIFGRGVYAPHQGLFPKHTSGIEDGRHIISRGAVNNAKPIPRFFNSPEVLEIHIISK